MFLRLLRRRLVSKVTTVPQTLRYVDTFNPKCIDSTSQSISCPTKAMCPTAEERHSNYVSRYMHELLNRYVVQGRNPFLN